MQKIIPVLLCAIIKYHFLLILAWQTDWLTVEHSSGFMAGGSGEKLFLVLKRVEMKQEWADKHVPFGSLLGSYWGLACHCMWNHMYNQHRLLPKCRWGQRPVLWGCSQLTASHLENFAYNKHSFCRGSLSIYTTVARLFIGLSTHQAKDQLLNNFSLCAFLFSCFSEAVARLVRCSCTPLVPDSWNGLCGFGTNLICTSQQSGGYVSLLWWLLWTHFSMSMETPLAG